MLDVRGSQIERAIPVKGSLARAAWVLGVGQPALTRSLAALEASLLGPLIPMQVRLARQRVQRRGMADRITLTEGSATAMPCRMLAVTS